MPSELTDLQRYERAAADGALPELIRELERAGEIFTLLARAIRIELAFLIEHPEEIFSRLYARCRFHGSAEEAALRRTEPGAPVPAFTPRPSSIGELLERWAAERTRSGRPWLRALHPADGVAGPLIEVYRCSGWLPVNLRIDDDERRIRMGIWRQLPPSGPDQDERRESKVVGWDRVTGKPFEEDPVVPLGREWGVHASPDGRFRLEARDWGECRLVETKSGATVTDLPIPEGRVWDVHFFGDGLHVAIVGDENEGDGLVMIYDLVSRSLVKRVVGGRTNYHVTGTRDGRCLATCDLERVTVWEWESQRVLASLPVNARQVAFSADGRTLFTESDGDVRVWDLERADKPGARIARDPWVANAAFSPDGTTLLLGAWLCDAHTGLPSARLEYWFGNYLEGGPAMDAFRITDNRIALLAENVDIWSARDGQRLIDGHKRFPRIHHAYWDLITISADARHFASTRRCDHERAKIPWKEVVISEIDTGSELSRFSILGASCLAFSPDGSRLAAGSCDGGVRVWDTKSGAIRSSFNRHHRPVSGVAFLGDGELAVSGAEDDSVCVWDSRSGVVRLRRDLRDDEPSYVFWHAGEGGGTRRYWRATPDAVIDAEIWAGLRPRPHPWRARHASGTLQIVHADTGQVAGTLPTNGAVVPHPSLPIWAGSGMHFVLEGWETGSSL